MRMLRIHSGKTFINILFNTSLGTQPCQGYSRRLPVLERFYRETKFSLLKFFHSTKNLKTKLRAFWWAPRVPIKTISFKIFTFKLKKNWIKITQDTHKEWSTVEVTTETLRRSESRILNQIIKKYTEKKRKKNTLNRFRTVVSEDPFFGFSMSRHRTWEREIQGVP